MINKDKKQRIDEIISTFVSINDEGNISYSPRVYSILNDTIDAIKAEWDSETILTEIIASYYQVMTRISDKYNIEEININNDRFMKEAYHKTKVEIATYLIDITRRSDKGFISTQKSTLSDELLNTEKLSYNLDDTDSIQNCFSSWFNENKNSFLTKKQLNFLEDNNTVSRSNISRIRKNIHKRAVDACSKEFNLPSTFSSADFNTKYELNAIEEILDSDEVYNALNKYKDNDFIANILEDISASSRILINKNIYNSDAIKELRKKLYIEYNKKYEQLYIL